MNKHHNCTIVHFISSLLFMVITELFNIRKIILWRWRWEFRLTSERFVQVLHARRRRRVDLHQHVISCKQITKMWSPFFESLHNFLHCQLQRFGPLPYHSPQPWNSQSGFPPPPPSASLAAAWSPQLQPTSCPPRKHNIWFYFVYYFCLVFSKLLIRKHARRSHGLSLVPNWQQREEGNWDGVLLDL